MKWKFPEINSTPRFPVIASSKPKIHNLHTYCSTDYEWYADGMLLGTSGLLLKWGYDVEGVGAGEILPEYGRLRAG